MAFLCIIKCNHFQDNYSKIPICKCNRCSIKKFIELALTLFFKRQRHRKLNWTKIKANLN
jgi:hypothetical protein